MKNKKQCKTLNQSLETDGKEAELLKIRNVTSRQAVSCSTLYEGAQCVQQLTVLECSKLNVTVLSCTPCL